MSPPKKFLREFSLLEILLSIGEIRSKNLAKRHKHNDYIIIFLPSFFFFFFKQQHT